MISTLTDTNVYSLQSDKTKDTHTEPNVSNICLPAPAEHIQGTTGGGGGNGSLSDINSPQCAPQEQTLVFGLYLQPDYLCLPATNLY